MNLHENLLISDFEQCFEQMRHYDDTFGRTLKFGFGGVAGVIAASAALVSQYGFTHPTKTMVGFLLLVSSIAGFLLVVSLARNRVYFAFVARYVNEIRSTYLAQAPGGVGNKAGVYTDHKSPKIFSPGSSHTIQIYFLSTCNALLLSATMVAFGGVVPPWYVPILAFAGSLLLQVGWVLRYLHSKEEKSANAAVFGMSKGESK